MNILFGLKHDDLRSSRGTGNKMKRLTAVAVLISIAGLTACSTYSRQLSASHGYGLKTDFKPIDQVAPHARAMVEGRMTLDQCLRQPESKADGGVGCISAIKDLPAR